MEIDIEGRLKEMISIFLLWTLHSYVEMYRQHIKMSLYLSVDPIFQSFWFLLWFPQYIVVANTEATEPSIPRVY